MSRVVFTGASSEISAAIEEWEERYRNLKEEDSTLDLPEEWKMTALQSILCGEIRKHVEYREEEFKSYDELRSTVMKWAVKWEGYDLSDQMTWEPAGNLTNVRGQVEEFERRLAAMPACVVA